MHIKVGLVGLPNVGKSSFFNALTGSFVQSENYPFCTINPNISRFIVNDERINKLVEVDCPNNIVSPTIEVYDIAGLVKGASKGEGLGNLFLSHIKEVDLILHVVRFFDNSNIIHVENRVDPINDIEIINLELIFKDIELIEKRIQSVKKDIAKGIKKNDELDVLNKIKSRLENPEYINVREDYLDENEKKMIKDLQLLTLKPVVYVGNVDENIDDNTHLHLKNIPQTDIVYIPIKLGADINTLSNEEKIAFDSEVNKWNKYINQLTKLIYEKLNVITFYTSGKDEVRGWPIYNGTLAPKAASEIHSDFEKHFIKADVCKFNNYYNKKKCGEAPEFLTYGKDYKICDGDVVNFKVGI